MGAERVVWQIGKPDHDYAEFAFAGDFPAYAKRIESKPLAIREQQRIRTGFSRPSVTQTFPLGCLGPAESASFQPVTASLLLMITSSPEKAMKRPSKLWLTCGYFLCHHSQHSHYNHTAEVPVNRYCERKL
jgi:hypothetical protein